MNDEVTLDLNSIMTWLTAKAFPINLGEDYTVLKVDEYYQVRYKKRFSMEISQIDFDNLIRNVTTFNTDNDAIFPINICLFHLTDIGKLFYSQIFQHTLHEIFIHDGCVSLERALFKFYDKTCMQLYFARRGIMTYHPNHTLLALPVIFKRYATFISPGLISHLERGLKLHEIVRGTKKPIIISDICIHSFVHKAHDEKINLIDTMDIIIYIYKSFPKYINKIIEKYGAILSNETIEMLSKI